MKTNNLLILKFENVILPILEIADYNYETFIKKDKRNFFEQTGRNILLIFQARGNISLILKNLGNI